MGLVNKSKTENSMTIAITGATGQLGRLAIESLKKRVSAATLVALARDPAKASDLGVEARQADYAKPETLAPALKGIATLVLISSSDFNDRAGQHTNVINAAVKAGVKRIIYTSILHGSASPMLIAEDHIATEAAIKSSGIPATILRNGWYLENYTTSLGASLEAGAMVGSAAEGKISAAGRADYAEAIAVTASQDGHAGKVYELAGDKAFTMAQMAAAVSKVSGKLVPYNNLPEAVYAGILQSFGLPEGFAKILADADACSAKGSLHDESKTLSSLIGRPTTSMDDAVTAALK